MQIISDVDKRLGWSDGNESLIEVDLKEIWEDKNHQGTLRPSVKDSWGKGRVIWSHILLSNYKGKKVPFQWRDLVDLTITNKLRHYVPHVM